MRKRLTSMLVAGIAGVAAFTLSASPAHAAAWVIEGNTNADGSYSASSGQTVLRIPSSGVELVCDSSSASGVIQNGQYDTGAGIGTITQTEFVNCSGPAGLTFEVTQVGTWNIDALEAAGTPGVTVGTVSNVQAELSGFSCYAEVEGGTPGTYDNADGTLTLSPDAPNPSGAQLVVTHVDPSQNCLGLISEGDVATYDAGYQVDPNTIDITPAA